MDNYRCHKAYINTTREKLISYTVEFFPRKFSMPKISSTDANIHAAQYLIHALKNSVPSSPLVTLRNAHKGVLRYLADIFGISISPEEPPRVPIEEAYPDNLQQLNKKTIKNPPITASNHPCRTSKGAN